MKKQWKNQKKNNQAKSGSAVEFKSWSRPDSDASFDWSKAKLNVYPNLKPSTQPTTIRWPAPLLNRIKLLANKRNVPYQSLVKTVMAGFVNEELRRAS